MDSETRRAIWGMLATLSLMASVGIWQHSFWAGASAFCVVFIWYIGRE